MCSNDFAAQQCLVQVQVYGSVQVIFIQFELRVVFNSELDVQITVGPAICPGSAMPFDFNNLTISYACGYGNADTVAVW